MWKLTQVLHYQLCQFGSIRIDSIPFFWPNCDPLCLCILLQMLEYMTIELVHSAMPGWFQATGCLMNLTSTENNCDPLEIKALALVYGPREWHHCFLAGLSAHVWSFWEQLCEVVFKPIKIVRNNVVMLIPVDVNFLWTESAAGSLMVRTIKDLNKSL